LAYGRLKEQAQSLRLAVERELALDEGVANALAASQDVDKGDWAAFHAMAKAASQVRPGGWFVVVDRDGENILNTNVPFGTPLPNARRRWRARWMPSGGGAGSRCRTSSCSTRRS
jgi:hypothetical protein